MTAARSGRVTLCVLVFISLALTAFHHLQSEVPIDPLWLWTWNLLRVFLAVFCVYGAVVIGGTVLNVHTRASEKHLSHVAVVKEVKFEPVSPVVWLVALWNETVINVRAFLFLFPFKDHTGIVAGTEQVQSPCPNQTPVLLVHGFLCNAGVWNALRPQLTRRGLTTHAITCNPPRGDLDDFADDVHAAVQVLQQATGCQQVRMLGHSMGGLIIRSYVKKYGDEAIESAMSLGTPHQGTVFAGMAQGICARQMDLGNPWLTQLMRSDRDQQFRRKLTAVWTPLENIVQPAASSLLPGARNWTVSRCGHLAMVEDPDTWALVHRWLEESAPAGV